MFRLVSTSVKTGHLVAKPFSLYILILLISGGSVYSQDPDTEEYTSEFIWGINKNTAGGLIGGLVLRKSRNTGNRLYESIGVEVMNVKHLQEVQIRSNSGSAFTFGKINYLYALRFQYGRERILFKKAPQKGVEIKFVVAVGPSLGLLAPYYIELGNGTSSSGTRREPYDPDNPSHRPENIFGPGYLLQGIQDSKVQIGANLKSGLSFEWGSIKSSVTGFEVGALLDAYTQNIELLAGVENKSIFPTVYVTIFYGTRR